MTSRRGSFPEAGWPWDYIPSGTESENSDSGSETSSPIKSGGLLGALGTVCVQGFVQNSATPERSCHLLVESPRMVEAFLMNLFLLEKPLGWHLRQLVSPWPVLDLGHKRHPHR